MFCIVSFDIIRLSISMILNVVNKEIQMSEYNYYCKNKPIPHLELISEFFDSYFSYRNYYRK